MDSCPSHDAGGGFVFDSEPFRRCRELAGKLSRGDVTHETAKDLSDDDGYLHSDDEGITDLPLASSLVEHALDALVEQGEVKKSGDDYALVVDDDGDWYVQASCPRRLPLGAVEATSRRWRLAPPVRRRCGRMRVSRAGPTTRTTTSTSLYCSRSRPRATRTRWLEH